MIPETVPPIIDFSKDIKDPAPIWGIDNSLHYVLDAAFGGDVCRIKSGNAPENMGFIRKTALYTTQPLPKVIAFPGLASISI